MESVPFERVLGKEVGGILKKLAEENGVNFIMQRTVKQFNGDGKVKQIVLDNGDIIDNVEVVVVGAGVIPETRYVKDLPLNPDGSLTTDKYLKVADGIFAAGDIAKFPYGDQNIRIEHWNVAHDTGRVAAHNMVLKDPVPYSQIPFFWTRSWDLSLQYTGYASSYDDIIIHGNTDKRSFVAYFILKNEVVAVAAMGKGAIVQAAQQLMKVKKMPSPDELRKSDINLVELVEKLQQKQ